MKLDFMVWMNGIAIKVLNEWMVLWMVLQVKVWMIRKEYRKLKLRTWIKWMDCDSL